MDAQPHQLRVAIVGGGPAGLATASNLLALAPGGVQIDIFDKAPTPFGLLRHGVAPDHTHHRATLADLAAVFDNPAVRFLGLVEMGRDVTRSDLTASYDAVVYATGAAEDHPLGIPGEDLAGVISSRAFSDWYSRAPRRSTSIWPVSPTWWSWAWVTWRWTSPACCSRIPTSSPPPTCPAACCSTCASTVCAP